LEIGSTFVFPLAAAVLTAHPFHAPTPVALALGVMTFQLALLIPSLAALVLVPTDSPNPAASFPVFTVPIFVFPGLSCFGHWIYDISVQQIAQTRVAVARHHVEFSNAEMTFVSAGRWASSAVWR